jgi:hypothetical protein
MICIHEGYQVMWSINPQVGVRNRFWRAIGRLEMTRIRTPALAVAAAIMLAFSSAANAGLIITMSEAGVVGPTVVATTAGNSALFNSSFGDYIVSINTAVTNSPGVNGLATLNVSSSETAGPLATGSSGILTINVQATGFTTPAANTSPVFMQSIGSNSSSSNAVMTFQSFLNTSPSLLQGPLLQGQSNTNITALFGGISPFPFTISNTTSIQVAPGAEGATSGSTEVAASPNFVVTPAPSSLVMLLSTVLAGGLGACGLRRRLAFASLGR